MREIAEILKEYNPDANYFTSTIWIKDNCINGNNQHWPDGEDENKPIDFYGPIFEEDK